MCVEAKSNNLEFTLKLPIHTQNDMLYTLYLLIVYGIVYS